MFVARSAYKDNPFSIGRPPRHGIFVYTRRQIADRVGAKIVKSNKAMPPALADERYMCTIGRPLGLNRAAVNRSQFLGVVRAILARKPQLLFRGPQRPLAVG